MANRVQAVEGNNHDNVIARMEPKGNITAKCRGRDSTLTIIGRYKWSRAFHWGPNARNIYAKIVTFGRIERYAVEADALWVIFFWLRGNAHFNRSNIKYCYLLLKYFYHRLVAF